MSDREERRLVGPSDELFDDLSRALANGVSRREALARIGRAVVAAALGAAVPGVALGAPGPRCKSTGDKCLTNQECCSRNCLEKRGRICGCPAGATLCNRDCVTCPHPGEVVNPATCQCGCPAGTVLCGGSCVSTTCPETQVFDPTTCSCVCPEGQFLCGSKCIDPCPQGTGCVMYQCDEQAETCVAMAGPCPTSGDICHNVECNMSTGMCEKTTPLADGTPCSSPNLCTQNETCQQGVCVGTTRQCPSDECRSTSCNPTTGNCDGPAAQAPNGTPCDDGNPCTTSDTCQEGICTGGAVVC